jgi:hypothetical protein
MIPVIIPPAACMNVFARLNRCSRTNNRYQVTVTARFNTEDAEASFRAVKGNPFDQSRHSFFLCFGLPLLFHNLRDYSRNNENDVAALPVPVHTISWTSPDNWKK